ncbi:MAG: SAM-dependent methyltransferase [Alphaproteobacteria bacterium]|nr:SAM-dependent methyltransferase [Alphaproteobacteria bacterium]
MRHFPIFLTLRGRSVLVLGSGDVAARKSEPLAAAGAEIRRRDRFDPADLDGCVLAVGADAPDGDLAALSAAAQGRGIPVNIVDRPQLCSCLMPAIVERDPITIAVSTGGAAPLLARLLRARIEAVIPPAFGRLATLGEAFAAELRSRVPDLAARRRILERCFGGRVAELVFAGNDAAARLQFAVEVAAGEHARSEGSVSFIGTGPGPADLVTLRAQRLMGEADVLVYDAALTPGIVALARRDARRIAIAGDTSSLLLELADTGHTVVRLCRGDGATDFAREAPTLEAAGISIQYVAGLAKNGTCPRLDEAEER